jgi:hypothetical protein
MAWLWGFFVGFAAAMWLNMEAERREGNKPPACAHEGSEPR